jgi:DNA-binding transcriptional LysR family regulator
MNFRTLDLNLLRVFDVVMVERNVTRSAERLAMTQPAVSNALRRLREAIGEELFQPGSTGVTPTPQAEAIWPAVREALGALRALFDPQDFDPTQAERSFTLAMADATAAVIVPLWVAEMERTGSRIALRVEPLATRDPRALLERGAADAAVGFFPDVAQELAAAGAQGEFLFDPLYVCDYVCAMRRDHPLAAAETLTLDDYCAAAHARVSFAGRPHGFVDAALAKLGRTRRVALVINHFATAARVVRSSDLLGVFPRRYLPVSGYADELVTRPLPMDMPLIEIAALAHRRHERDAAHRWLRGTLARIVPRD